MIMCRWFILRGFFSLQIGNPTIPFLSEGSIASVNQPTARPDVQRREEQEIDQ
jgi:hypothetical protein